MKTRIVLWGNNDKQEKVLIAIELIEAESNVQITTFPEDVATELFYNQMMNQWREGEIIPFPDPHEMIVRPLTITDGLLPDNLKTTRADILARAKTEWHFVVLSAKLYSNYEDEVKEFKERIEQMSDFDNSVWEEMKGFWQKVQQQVFEKNLFREHANELRARTNRLFDDMKKLRRSMNEELDKLSKEHLDKFYGILDDVEDRIEKGLGLQPIFNELKQIQKNFKLTEFNRKHGNEVWKRIDTAFKLVKEKKFGKAPESSNSAVGRLTRRYEGLLSAIKRMENSIGKDSRDKEFQQERINTTDGQLELQIRQAKLAMIDERISSKQKKLDEMLKTKVELEAKIDAEKQREQRREEVEKVEEAKAAIKNEIAQDIKVQSAELKENKPELEKAAEAILASKKKEPIKPKSEITKTTTVPIAEVDPPQPDIEATEEKLDSTEEE